MQVDEIRDYCLGKDDVTEGFPFGPTALVFKTAGKMFLLMMLDELPVSVNLKCDPETALQLREEYACVLPGYHMNKKHWNTVILGPSLPPDVLRGWIDNSYNLVRPRRKVGRHTL
ncbi:MAG: MmcQ/YjbR family DNA-binding protein [Candidatus Sumerlaeaceae bacterium]